MLLWAARWQRTKLECRVASGAAPLSMNKNLTATIWSRTAPFFRSWLLKRSSGNSCTAEERRKCQSQCSSTVWTQGQTLLPRDWRLCFTRLLLNFTGVSCSVPSLSPTSGHDSRCIILNTVNTIGRKPTAVQPLDHWSKSFAILRTWSQRFKAQGREKSLPCWGLIVRHRGLQLEHSGLGATATRLGSLGAPALCFVPCKSLTSVSLVKRLEALT